MTIKIPKNSVKIVIKVLFTLRCGLLKLLKITKIALLELKLTLLNYALDKNFKNLVKQMDFKSRLNFFS